MKALFRRAAATVTDALPTSAVCTQCGSRAEVTWARRMLRWPDLVMYENKCALCEWVGGGIVRWPVGTTPDDYAPRITL